MLLGFGRVGRALADQIGAANGGGQVRVVGLLDRSGYIFEPRGISRRRLTELAREKDGGELLAALGGRPAPAAEALAVMAGHAVSRPVVVDVTSEETGDLLRAALGNGFDVVLANKKPLAGSWESYAALVSAPALGSRQVRYEATVGAGLPIIDTYHKLVETGDRVLRIDGCVSGTLMYVVSAVSEGRPFSQAVREAVDLGYAEPDPRDDLSGADAARKALILARLMGYRGAATGARRFRPARAQETTPGQVHDPSFRGRRRLEGAGCPRSGTRPRAALRGDGHTARRVRAADGGAGIEPDRRSAGHAQPGGVHDPALPQGAACRSAVPAPEPR